jgi:glutamyl-tRNA reductase
LRDALIEADIVVTSSAADEPIIRADEFVAIMKSRRQRLVAIIDIAVPRDVDVAVGELPNVLLWNIDDLEKVRNKTLRARRSEMQSAGKIIAEELSRLQSAWAAQKTGPLISQLDQEYQRIIEEELSWLFPQLNGLPEGQADKIRQFAHRVKNKLLHSPKIAIREQAQEGHHGLLETVQRLFGLGRPSAGDDGS